MLLKFAEHDPICRLFMTIPGVGPVTAITYKAAIDDPHRFAKSSNVGAYLGLTPRKYASGEMDYNGRISKTGDPMVREMLYEAAGSMLINSKKWSSLKAWGLRVAKRSSLKKARVAVARKLAVIMHAMWKTGETFRYSDAPPATA
jgi:transposase